MGVGGREKESAKALDGQESEWMVENGGGGEG